MAAIRRMVAAAPQAATLAVHENEKQMYEGLLLAAAAGRAVLPPLVTDFASNVLGGHAEKPKTSSVAKPVAPTAKKSEEAATPTTASAPATSEAPVTDAHGQDGLRAFLDEETGDEHSDEWAKGGELDAERLGWRHKSKFKGQFKCNLLVTEGLRRGGYIEPGTDTNGHVETPSVDDMVKEVDEVKATGALSGKAVQWFDIVPDVAHAQPNDLILIAAKDRMDGVTSNGHVGIITDIAYDSAAGRIERVRVAEASSSRGAVDTNPGFSEPHHQRTTWGPAPGHNKEISSFHPGVIIIRPRKATAAE